MKPNTPYIPPPQYLHVFATNGAVLTTGTELIPGQNNWQIVICAMTLNPVLFGNDFLASRGVSQYFLRMGGSTQYFINFYPNYLYFPLGGNVELFVQADTNLIGSIQWFYYNQQWYSEVIK